MFPTDKGVTFSVQFWLKFVVKDLNGYEFVSIKLLKTKVSALVLMPKLIFNAHKLIRPWTFQ